MDERIFDQLDRLQRGARDIGIPPPANFQNSSEEYSAYSGYGGGGYSEYDGYVPVDTQHLEGPFQEPQHLNSYGMAPAH